jgi:carboxylate-amine ligase
MGEPRVPLPAWARWNDSWGHRYTVGVEEEVVVLNAADHSPAQASEWVRARLPASLAVRTSPETHAAVIELTTGTHATVAGAVAELQELRGALAHELDAMSLCAASTGTHPLAVAEQTRVVDTARYRTVASSMRMLAQREPTMALHVHVGVPDPEDAVRLLNRLRDAVPALLALSANSPFWAGIDSGFASARTVIFQAFPRTGIPRRFVDYADYVGVVDALVGSGAIPDPTFLWWDVRLQPALGTVEVRVMDAQITLAHTAALVALVHALARVALEGDDSDGLEGDDSDGAATPEVLAENRFLAARDGVEAELIDPETRRLVPVRALIGVLLDRCRAHANPVGSIELERVRPLVWRNGADRQRACATECGIPGLVDMLTRRFAPSAPTPRSDVAGLA